MLLLKIFAPKDVLLHVLKWLLSPFPRLTGMASHPPVPISELADHIERLKANDNLKFSQEYEVGVLIIYSWKKKTALLVSTSAFSLTQPLQFASRCVVIERYKR